MRAAAVGGIAAAVALAVAPSVERSARTFSAAPSRLRVRVVAPRPATAAGEVDVSRATLAQAEVAVAVDRGNPSVLLAASNSQAPEMQVYESVDGGNSWTSAALPVPDRLCAFGDPAPAIGPDGSQYVGFLAGNCSETEGDVSLALAARQGPGEPWTAHTLNVPGERRPSDKDALAVDTRPSSPARGRLYVAWSRFVTASNTRELAMSHSDDRGATWSPAVKVSPAHAVLETFASIAIGSGGEVYVAWLTGDGRIELARSGYGGEQFGAPLLVGHSLELAPERCDFAGGRVVAEPRRCVTPAPLLSVDPARQRLYVTYAAAAGPRRALNVYAAPYETSPLRQLGAPHRVNPPDGRVASDQFLPASAVDESTGRLWACWYDTRGDTARRRTRYTCSSSRDSGRTWSAPIVAASVFSNETVSRATRFAYGDYAGLAVANGAAHPIWTDSRDLRSLGEEIYTRRLAVR